MYESQDTTKIEQKENHISLQNLKPKTLKNINISLLATDNYSMHDDEENELQVKANITIKF